MRRIVTWALSTVTVLVLLFSYHTSTSSASAPTAKVAGPAAASGSGSLAAGSAAAPPAGSSAAAAPSTASGSAGSGSSGSAQSGAIAGDAVMTRYGAVQVQITVSGGKITAADVLQVPNQDRRDQMINGQAVPILDQEAVAAQSSRIDSVSGATYTSDGYIQSLQSAIDKAHL